MELLSYIQLEERIGFYIWIDAILMLMDVHLQN